MQPLHKQQMSPACLQKFMTKRLAYLFLQSWIHLSWWAFPICHSRKCSTVALSSVVSTEPDVCGRAPGGGLVPFALEEVPFKERPKGWMDVFQVKMEEKLFGAEEQYLQKSWDRKGPPSVQWTEQYQLGLDWKELWEAAVRWVSELRLL